MKSPATAIGIVMVWIMVTLFAATGYGLNIYKLTQCDFQAPYKAEAIHTLGLIPVVGVFTGWIDVGK